MKDDSEKEIQVYIMTIFLKIKMHIRLHIGRGYRMPGAIGKIKKKYCGYPCDKI